MLLTMWEWTPLTLDDVSMDTASVLTPTRLLLLRLVCVSIWSSFKQTNGDFHICMSWTGVTWHNTGHDKMRRRWRSQCIICVCACVGYDVIYNVNYSHLSTDLPLKTTSHKQTDWWTEKGGNMTVTTPRDTISSNSLNLPSASLWHRQNYSSHTSSEEYQSHSAEEKKQQRLNTFMQDVSQCDSLPWDGDVFDFSFGLHEGDTPQVVLLYTQRWVACGDGKTHALRQRNNDPHVNETLLSWFTSLLAWFNTRKQPGGLPFCITLRYWY